MEDMKVLSKQILERTKQAGQIKLENYQTEANKKIEETRERLVLSEQQQKESIELDLNNEYERQVQTLANQQRNRLLAEKQTLLNDVFEEALVEINNWDQTKYSEFLTGVLSQLDNQKEWTFVPGELSSDLVQTDQVKAVLNNFSFVNVSDQVVKNKAGFILEQGGIDYNFCFDALINELKKEFSPQLATLAFKNNE